MLLLILSINNERYAIESRQVVEVIPLVILKSLPHKPEYIAGVFNYRGRIVPVIDLSELMAGKPSCENFSTRIVLVKYWGKNSTEVGEPYILGLMAEQIVETLQKSESEFVDSNIQIDAAPYLGKMIVDTQGMIQCLRIENLLSETQQVNLLAESGRNAEF
ncbi:MAG: chemotaxis protein CheW [Nostoc sp. ZfuVER08]|jgi:chemotaxis-related protein WspB|uniref:Chemotaxis protein CheW n=1 Tax=Nostoc punctiforme FACHB-252 TaxID=1357509 RepID=A0ABR8H575_NOSPU|nr:chemotaxis protein CheW [Nostoc punctiforme]MBD2610982.1 chemotaxis protein CheW [Nostoc punctiforme FACHB-252]MBL1197896.1 chemotaxis protein CheW [Nostoc sp. GBBB01]MDZ8016509.1 chemotaxis protein CheW [Nostoc sp. ZfuVER08]